MLGFRRPTCPQVSEQCPIASRVAAKGWLSARASQQGDRAASAASGARKGWKLKLVPPGPNDGRGQLESLGRTRLIPDAPYKACSGFTRALWSGNEGLRVKPALGHRPPRR